MIQSLSLLVPRLAVNRPRIFSTTVEGRMQTPKVFASMHSTHFDLRQKRKANCSSAGFHVIQFAFVLVTLIPGGPTLPPIEQQRSHRAVAADHMFLELIKKVHG